MKQAHELARKTVEEVGNYQIALSFALKKMWAEEKNLHTKTIQHSWGRVKYDNHPELKQKLRRDQFSELVGSEKQIAWAKDIRERKAKSFEAYLEDKVSPAGVAAHQFIKTVLGFDMKIEMWKDSEYSELQKELGKIPFKNRPARKEAAKPLEARRRELETKYLLEAMQAFKTQTSAAWWIENR